MLVHALEAGDHDDIAAVEVVADSVLVDLDDARLGERVVGEDAHLRAGIALGLDAHVHQRHRGQRDRDLLAGGDHRVEFARVGFRHDFLGQVDQAVGLAGHRGDHHHDLMPERLVARHAARHVADAFRIGDGGAAVFLYDQCHVSFR